jgi:hypothetical protein
MKFFAFLIVFSCFLGTVSAQEQRPALPTLGKNDTIKTYLTVLDGEMVPWIVVPDVIITATRIFKSEADRRAFNMLKYNVRKVIPYAHFAGSRYRQLQRDLALTADKKKQKELIEACNTQVKDMFKKEVMNLTINQGEILIKLINRETDMTTFEELKGGFNAFLLQSAAKIFGHNLKQTYDISEQRDIEAILQEAGYDSYRN